jgi:cysteine desulfuration protein SufE
MTPEQRYPEKLRDLLDTFDALPGFDDRASLLIDLASSFTPVPAAVATPPYDSSHRVPFCESEAYVWAVPDGEGRLKFYFAVENPSGISAKALATILQKTLSGSPVDQVASVPPEIVNRIFRQNISMGKGMGLMGMVQMAKSFAAATGNAAKG